MRPTSNLLTILRQYIGPGILAGVTLDSYSRQIDSHQAEILKISKIKEKEIEKLQNQLWGDKTVNSEFKVKLETASGRIKEVDEKIIETESKLNQVDSKLSTPSGPFRPADGHGDIFANSESSQSFNTTTSTDAKFLTNSKEYYSGELERLKETKNSLVKELQEAIDKSIDKSDIYSYFSNFLEHFRNFVDQLSLEQLVALFNIIGFGMVFSMSISITILLIGDYLIDKLRLELRYPKLVKYIRIKKEFNKLNLMFSLTMYYLVVIAFILANIYMLLLKYFV